MPRWMRRRMMPLKLYVSSVVLGISETYYTTSMMYFLALARIVFPILFLLQNILLCAKRTMQHSHIYTRTRWCGTHPPPGNRSLQNVRSRSSKKRSNSTWPSTSTVQSVHVSNGRNFVDFRHPQLDGWWRITPH